MQETTSNGEVFEPPLTFPVEVADFVSASYSKADCILEYGSGGSTVFAARNGRPRLYSVESDIAWATNLQRFLDEEGLASKTTLWHMDIGPTVEWGAPAVYRRTNALRYYGYANTAWNRLGNDQPDIVLIDGRFRVGCFLATAANIRKPTRVLFDDYTNRDNYRYVERFARPVETVGRMAIFDLEPVRFSLALKLANCRRFLDYS